MLTLSGILRYSTWPTKSCNKILSISAQSSDICQTFTTLFMPFCCFIAFFKHVKLCFRPLSDFVIPHVKMLGWGILESLCPCVHLFVYLSIRLCPEGILWTAQPFVSKPEMVCHAQESGCYLQGQGHNKGFYNHNMTVSTISMLRYLLNWFVFVFLPNLVCWETIISQNILWGHSNGSKCNLMLVQMIPSEPLKLQ